MGEELKRWPQIEEWVKSGILPYIDYLVAEKLEPESEAAAALICHLSAAARAGFSSIHVGRDEVSPSPALWSRNDEREWETAASELICRGKTLFKESNEQIHCCGERYAFQRYQKQEEELLLRFHALAAEEPLHAAAFCGEAPELEPEQREAVAHSCRHAVTLLCGGPGTGKTHTAGFILKFLFRALDEESKRSWKALLAAPTGKAAANLQASIRRAAGTLPGPLPEAKTLHSLLGVGTRRAKAMIDADLLLIDESSMIDLELFSKLLEAVKPGARLILLGDPHQLPPVGVGAPFSQLASKGKGVVTLGRCLRQELAAITTAAAAVNQGDSGSFLKLLEEGTAEKGLERIAFNTPKEIAARASGCFPTKLDRFSEEELLEAFNNFRLLTPLKQGPWGFSSLNRLIGAELRGQLRYRSYHTAPIHITANDKRLQLFNGDAGLLFCKEPDQVQKGDYALFSGRDGKPHKLPALLLPSYDYSYCLSVHKSQGSEFSHVLLLLPEGSETFGRELLYTGITRAKRLLQIAGSDKVITDAISKEK